MSRIPEAIKNKFPQPNEQVIHFLKEVIEVTAKYCAAYKPNLAFFEALGAGGLTVFEEVINFIPDDKIIIADAKRGDISSTADHYAKAYFKEFDVDALTLNPLMGFDTLEPFLRNEKKGVFVLTLTSNPGASDFLLAPFNDKNSMAEYIAPALSELNKKSAAHIGMVTGATHPKGLRKVIEPYPEGALLIPGIGAQGGSIDDLKAVLKNHKGTPVFNSSRGILYAGEGKSDWKKAIEAKTQESKEQINAIFKINA